MQDILNHLAYSAGVGCRYILIVGMTIWAIYIITRNKKPPKDGGFGS